MQGGNIRQWKHKTWTWTESHIMGRMRPAATRLAHTDLAAHGLTWWDTLLVPLHHQDYPPS